MVAPVRLDVKKSLTRSIIPGAHPTGAASMRRRAASAAAVRSDASTAWPTSSSARSRGRLSLWRRCSPPPSPESVESLRWVPEGCQGVHHGSPRHPAVSGAASHLPEPAAVANCLPHVATRKCAPSGTRSRPKCRNLPPFTDMAALPPSAVSRIASFVEAQHGGLLRLRRVCKHWLLSANAELGRLCLRFESVGPEQLPALLRFIRYAVWSRPHK